MNSGDSPIALPVGTTVAHDLDDLDADDEATIAACIVGKRDLSILEGRALRNILQRKNFLRHGYTSTADYLERRFDRSKTDLYRSIEMADCADVLEAAGLPLPVRPSHFRELAKVLKHGSDAVLAVWQGALASASAYDLNAQTLASFASAYVTPKKIDVVSEWTLAEGQSASVVKTIGDDIKWDVKHYRPAVLRDSPIGETDAQATSPVLEIVDDAIAQIHAAPPPTWILKEIVDGIKKGVHTSLLVHEITFRRYPLLAPFRAILVAAVNFKIDYETPQVDLAGAPVGPEHRRGRRRSRKSKTAGVKPRSAAKTAALKTKPSPLGTVLPFAPKDAGVSDP